MVCTRGTHDRHSRFLGALLLSGGLLLAALLAVSHAQITLDGSLGPAGPLAGPHYCIGADVGQIRGSNLLHSFGAFNVPTGGSATFTDPAEITNILSRVSGGQPSAIDGLLRSEIAGANLYLLSDPSPGARLAQPGVFRSLPASWRSAGAGSSPARPSALGMLGRLWCRRTDW